MAEKLCNLSGLLQTFEVQFYFSLFPTIVATSSDLSFYFLLQITQMQYIRSGFPREIFAILGSQISICPT